MFIVYIAIFCCAESGWDPAEIGDLLEDRFYNKIFKVLYQYKHAESCQHSAGSLRCTLFKCENRFVICQVFYSLYVVK